MRQVVEEMFFNHSSLAKRNYILKRGKTGPEGKDPQMI
jgi:hypothetical protein